MDRRAGVFSRRLALVAVLVGVALAGIASGAQAKGLSSVHGTVVHRDAGAGSFVVANRKGRLFAIHSASPPALGSKVKVSVHQLRNGTLGGSVTKASKSKRPARVKVHGVVSHTSAHTFTLSHRGVSMLVKTRAGHSAPAVGTAVTVTGTEDEENEGEIEEEDLQEEGEDSNGFQIEGTILEVNELTRTLTVSSEDNDQTGETVAVFVPETLNIGLFVVGETVELNVQPREGGGFELLGSSDDEGEQGANEDEQGDLGEGEQGENEQ